MKTAIIYSTTHGSTEKVAEYISEKINDGEATVIRLEKNSKIDINSFDRIILGGSVYLGDIQSQMTKFCEDNIAILETKIVGLFTCGIEPELVRTDDELEMAFPKKLFNHAVATAFVGGEISFEKLNPTQKFISKNFFKIDDSVNFFHFDLVDIFVYQMLSA